MSSYAEFAKALVPLAWPILIAFVLWKLFPAIKKLVEARAFTVKFAGLEITAQEATDQIKSQLQDLKDQVVALRKVTGEISAATPSLSETPASVKDAARRTILWVDDKPSNNALEISQLEERGYKIIIARSTSEAMAILSAESVGLIISDMGRKENDRYDGRAGINLLKEARDVGYKQPLIVYTTWRGANETDAEVKALGGDGAITSPIRVLEWIEDQNRR